MSRVAELNAEELQFATAAKAAAQVFVENTPAYHPTPQNSQALLETIHNMGLKPIDVASYERAFDEMCQRLVKYEVERGGTKTTLTGVAALEEMPADALKQRLRDPAFMRGADLILGRTK